MCALERIRRLCLAASGATERLSHGSPCFFASNKRQFAAFDDHHQPDGRIALWLAAPLGAQELLMESDPETFFRPPYVGVRGWVGVFVDRVDDDTLAGLIEEAHQTITRRRAGPEATPWVG
ncbi:MAG TPA: MmcQ/YjbR family DNA-binding protein [Fimbriimonadaceae bacterium]|nr:MmcQ/YjbR family DNA-binding protein [Fimbriimonadaceae bacterium]